MIDPWDFDSNHPAWVREAEYGTRRFICVLEDADGDESTYVGECDYVVNSEGVVLKDVRYWPNDLSVREDIWSYCVTLF